MIRKICRNFEEILGVLLLTSICVVAVVKVASRYLFRNPSSWAEEVATYLFVWMTFVGASLALKKHEHFAIEILVDKLPERAAACMRLVSALLVVIFSMIVVWYGAKLTVHGWHAVTPATEIPRSIPYAAVPFGGLLMLVRSMEYFIRQIAGLKHGRGIPLEEKAA